MHAARRSWRLARVALARRSAYLRVGLRSKKPKPKKWPAVAPAAHARDATIEAAIAAGPEDREAHRVYADWLQAQGDSLGEVIAVALAALDEPKALRKLKVNAIKGLDRYIEAFWIPKFPLLEHRFRAWNKTDPQASPDRITNWTSSRIVFRWGLIRELGMIYWPAPMVRQGLELLRHPDVRFVEEVNLNSVSSFADTRVFEGRNSLRRLDLSKTKVRDLEPLARLDSLESLELFKTPVECIDALAGSRLVSLNLRSTRVTDLRPLTKLSTLESINIEATGISDIEPLFELPRLRVAWLYQTSVSKAAADKLEQLIDSRHTSDRPSVYGP